MTEQEKDNLFFVCTMIEYVSRQTKNHRHVVVDCLEPDGLDYELQHADVNHCLPMEQVSDEWIEEYHIPTGNFDNVADCRYTVPSVTSIGRLYQRLILDVQHEQPLVDVMRSVFSSFIMDEINYFNSNVYYQNPDYLRCSYEAGHMLA